VANFVLIHGDGDGRARFLKCTAKPAYSGKKTTDLVLGPITTLHGLIVLIIPHSATSYPCKSRD
jgi:hypothetical protein